MKEYINEIIHSGKIGLFLCELPTGYGKTFRIVQTIRDCALNTEEKRKIIYLTTLNKNLPEKDLLNAFGSIDEYNKHVLRIRSNFDEVTEKFEKIDIPNENVLYLENYKTLKKLVKQYNKAVADKVSDKEYLESLKNRINETEKKFRNYISAKLKKEYPDKKSRLEAIWTNEKWKWVGELYPAVFTDDHQILIMSINKFMAKNSCIIEPSYDFLTSSLIDGAIIIIDEFDATKATIEDAILNEALSVKADYLNMFRQIIYGMNPDNMARDLKEAYKRMAAASPSSYTFDKIRDEADAILMKYHVNLSFKTKDDSIDHKQNFLLKDASYHTLSQNGKSYIRASENVHENKVMIHLEKKADYEKNKSDNDISVFSMLRDINRFLLHFRIFLYQWADQYMHGVNAGRDSNEDAMKQEAAINTILDKLSINKADRPLLLHESSEYARSLENKKSLPDNSFYATGLELFELEDEDSHHDSTKLQLAAIYNTPEKILRYLSEISTIIGISATAEVKTVTGNYDLDYLQEKLRESFHRTPNEVKARIEHELSNAWKAYDDGRVKIHAEMVKDQSLNFDATSVCKSFFHDPDIAEACAGVIQEKVTNPYILQRYCNIAWAMHQFCCLPIRSMLYLGMALPDSNKDEMNTQVLHEILKCVIDDVSEYSALTCENMDPQKSLVILRSSNFDETKAGLTVRLGNGEKIFIMSTYQTLGAGQNLQYKVPKDIPIVELVPYQDDGDQRHFYKDIDSMYLGDVTNLVVNVNGEKFEEKEFLTMLIQIEEMYQHDEMNYMEKEDMIKIGFRAFTGTRDGNCLPNSMYKKDSTFANATKVVMQAIGRMCRTYMKSPDIYIFIDEKLLDKVSAGEMEKHNLTPEMKAIVGLRKKLGKDYSYAEQRILNMAEKISSLGSLLLHRILFKEWDDRTMRMWKNIRLFTLQLPLAWKDEYVKNAYARELYITSGNPQDRYFYSQFGDYQDVIIDFGTDKAAFRNSPRAKRKEDRGQLNIQEVNEEESGLPILMKYPGMKEYFLSQGYAVKWEPKDYIMSPVLFHNIYKGALGEVAGKFILEKELGVHLTEIEEPSNFELFDYKMAEGVYVDFKNWKNDYFVDRANALEKVRAKLKAIGGKRAYIISVIETDKNDESTGSIDDSVIEISGLIDRDGHPLYKNLKMIKEEDF